MYVYKKSIDGGGGCLWWVLFMHRILRIGRSVRILHEFHQFFDKLTNSLIR